MNNPNILIVDDDKFFCDIKTTLLERNNYKVESIQSADLALDKLKTTQFDLILLDLKIGDSWGIDILRQIKEFEPGIIVIMITAFEDISVAVDAIKKGAYDYLTKGISDEELLVKIARALDKHKDLLEISTLKGALTERFSFSNLVGVNKNMQKIYALIKDISSTDVTVLIAGETGTGKELIAKAIHFNSPRKDNPFVAVNCAAISEHLMESEVFGHEKGAFTDAYKQRIGKVEIANSGTLFLDEIGDMSINLQAKLLRFLQDKQFERVGGNIKLTSDVRIISATNKDLLKLIEIGRFREDLYYRINVIRMDVPPLRERPDDIPLLIEHFIKQANIKFKKKVKGISEGTTKQLLEYKWPGNIRELENLINRLILTTDSDIINIEDISGFLVPTKETPEGTVIDISVSLRDARNEFEKMYLLGLLKKYNGNINLVSEKSGMNRKSIFLKLREYGLKKEEFK